MKYILIFLLTINLYSFDAFVSPSELKSSFEDKNLVIIDVESKDLYLKNHISGAIHADISDFINISNKKMLMSSSADIQSQLKKLGINSDSNVVIYSHNTNSGVLNSSYLALVLISNGFSNVSILDGGLLAWIFEFPILSSVRETIKVTEGNFTVSNKVDIMVDLNYIKESKKIILDSRSTQHYYGIKKSKNIKQLGHIPFSKSSYYKDKFLADGTIRNTKDLKKIFIDGYELDVDNEVIIYGDNLLMASMNWYILYHMMGFKNTKIYEASLVEWGNKKELPMTRFKWE